MRHKLGLLAGMMALALFSWLSPALAQDHSFPTPGNASVGGAVQMCWNGTAALPCSPSSPGVVTVVPYAYTPLTPGQHNLAITTSTALTVPTGATYATICATGANVNYTTDGTTTPTSSVGQPILAGQCEAFSGPTVLANFKAIQQTATATLNTEYFK